MVKYKLTLFEKKIQLDSVVVEVEEGKEWQLINHIRKLKISNTALYRPRTKVIKELIN